MRIHTQQQTRRSAAIDQNFQKPWFWLFCVIFLGPRPWSPNWGDRIQILTQCVHGGHIHLCAENKPIRLSRLPANRFIIIARRRKKEFSLLVYWILKKTFVCCVCRLGSKYRPHRQTYGGALLQHPKSWGSSRWPCFPCSDAREESGPFVSPNDVWPPHSTSLRTTP